MFATYEGRVTKRHQSSLVESTFFPGQHIGMVAYIRHAVLREKWQPAFAAPWVLGFDLIQPESVNRNSFQEYTTAGLRATSTKFDLQADNMKFKTKNEE
jgi:hypothetical protein